METTEDEIVVSLGRRSTSFVVTVQQFSDVFCKTTMDVGTNGSATIFSKLSKDFVMQAIFFFFSLTLQRVFPNANLAGVVGSDTNTGLSGLGKSTNPLPKSSQRRKVCALMSIELTSTVPL